MLVYEHEAIFERPEIEGARRRRLWNPEGGGREDLLGFDAHHKALAKQTTPDRRRPAESDPRQALQEGGDAPRVAAQAPRGQRRPHPRRAPRGVRGGVRAERFYVHYRQSHSRSARWRMAAQKSHPWPQSATRRRGGCGGGSHPAWTPGASCSWTRVAFTPP